VNTVKRDGVAIAYQEVGSGSLPLLLVHGFACDHTFLAPQLAFFSRSHRTVAVDLRGHGMSDAPHQEYTMTGFADDLAWLCAELNLKQPVIVGHSMGGNIALELAARYPDLPAAIALIDSVVLPPPGFTEALRPLAEDLKGPHYLNALERVGALLFLPTDDAKRKSRLLATMGQTQQHVISSAFRNHITEYDSTPTIKACRVPIAYISAAVSMASVDRFQELYPQLITGQTIGSGHFSPLEVPNQINAMLERFLEISLIRLREQFSPSTPDKTARATEERQWTLLIRREQAAAAS
jgi:pimeloyl-ACP methyl ester carboxylesterase